MAHKFSRSAAGACPGRSARQVSDRRVSGRGVSGHLAMALVLTLAGPLAGCAENRPYVAASGPEMAPHQVESDYHLGPNDKVKITVFNEPSLTGEFSVGANRMISFPLIGDIVADNLTAPQLSDAIAAKLAQGFIKNPKVAVEVETFRPYYVLGEVNHAGKYEYVSGLTVLQAIASAEGFSYRANKRKVLIRRSGASDEVPTEISPDLLVHPGDTIRVTERYF